MIAVAADDAQMRAPTRTRDQVSRRVSERTARFSITRLRSLNCRQSPLLAEEALDKKGGRNLANLRPRARHVQMLRLFLCLQTAILRRCRHSCAARAIKQQRSYACQSAASDASSVTRSITHRSAPHSRDRSLRRLVADHVSMTKR